MCPDNALFEHTKKPAWIVYAGFDFFWLRTYLVEKGCLTIATFNNRMTGDSSPVAVSLLLTL